MTGTPSMPKSLVVERPPYTHFGESFVTVENKVSDDLPSMSIASLEHHCSRKPNTVVVPMLFLSMRGSNPSGPWTTLTLSFWAPLITCRSRVNRSEGVRATL